MTECDKPDCRLVRLQKDNLSKQIIRLHSELEGYRKHMRENTFNLLDRLDVAEKGGRCVEPGCSNKAAPSRKIYCYDHR